MQNQTSPKLNELKNIMEKYMPCQGTYSDLDKYCQFECPFIVPCLEKQRENKGKQDSKPTP
jgi:hypothetical protein